MDLLSDDLLYCCLARVPFASYDALRLVSRRLRGACGSEGYARERDRFRESLVVVCGGSDWGYRREAWLLTPDRTWLARPALPFGRDAFCLTAARPFGDELYATGGRLRGYEASAAVSAFDARAGTWRECAPMLQARFGHGAAALRPKPKLALVAVAPRRRRPAEQRRISVTQKPLLVVAGGYRDDAELASAEALDLVTGRWRAIAPLPFATCYAAAAVVDGRFYVAGGAGPGDGRLQMWDPATGEWARRADLPQSRQSAAAVVAAGRLYLIGGLLDLGETASVIRYCPTSDAWRWGEDARAIPWLPKPRSGATAALLADGSVLLVGGGSPLVCRRDGDGYRAWEDVADLPIGWVRWPGAATVEL
ncbi:hypothetical protein SO694_000134112 [Aureococcus anophagefferens]|uniref:F-box domain-containing protein n=1 Tax=Aureococcus anophagefferens TaxID=44056 RepID=A0ABR1G195_AURAN